MEGDAGEGLSGRLGNLRAHRAVFGEKWELQEGSVAGQCIWQPSAGRSLRQAAGVGLFAKSFRRVSPGPGPARGRHCKTGSWGLCGLEFVVM